MSRRQIIADTETTGLSPERDQVWEIGLIRRDTEERFLWRIKPDLARADPGALAVGRYYERTADMCRDCTRPERAYNLDEAPGLKTDKPEWSSPLAVAGELAPLLDGATLIGAVPSFDAGFLAAFLRQNGHAPTWHYRLRDIGSMAYGYLSGYLGPRNDGGTALVPMDAGTDDFAEALGVDPAKFDRHSALGDCELVAAMLDAIEARP